MLLKGQWEETYFSEITVIKISGKVTKKYKTIYQKQFKSLDLSICYQEDLVKQAAPPTHEFLI